MFDSLGLNYARFVFYWVLMIPMILNDSFCLKFTLMCVRFIENSRPSRCYCALVVGYVKHFLYGIFMVTLSGLLAFLVGYGILRYIREIKVGYITVLSDTASL